MRPSSSSFNEVCMLVDEVVIPRFQWCVKTGFPLATKNALSVVGFSVC